MSDLITTELNRLLPKSSATEKTFSLPTSNYLVEHIQSSGTRLYLLNIDWSKVPAYRRRENTTERSLEEAAN